MKRFFLAVVLCLGVVAANAQAVEKTFADLKNEGNAAIKVKDYAKALDLYEKALVKWGDKPVADTSMIYNMGYCAINSKNYDKAVKYFDQAISMNYKKANAYVYLSDIYKIQKKNAESLKALESALAIAPADAIVKDKLAAYYVREAYSLYGKGSSIINKANSQVTAGKLKTTDAPYKAADTQAKEEYKKVIPLAEKALEFDPKNATAKQLKDACEQAIKL